MNGQSMVEDILKKERVLKFWVNQNQELNQKL